MKPVRLLPALLAVLGCALVVCGARGGPSSAAAAATPVAYAPPALAATPAPHHPVHVTSGHRQPAHTAARAAKPQPRHLSRPSAAPKPPAPTPVATHSTKPTHVVTVYVSGPTHWSALNAAIARIPTYRSGAAHWLVSSKYDFWGTADWYHDVLYVDPSVPVDKLYDVAVHEWSHELSVLDYGGDVAAATRAMNAAFGGTGLAGPEKAADCMAILQGATWTHYTTCSNPQWRSAAARLVAGKKL